MDFSISIANKDNTDLAEFVRSASEFKARLDIDTENNVIKVFESSDDEASMVINLVYKFFDIKGIRVYREEYDSRQDYFPKFKDFTNLKTEGYAEMIQRQLYFLLSNIDFAMETLNMPEEEIYKLLISVNSELGRMYNVQKYQNFTIGDVVDCNFGYHIRGEVSGGHVLAIVLEVDSAGMIYVVPISKQVYDKDSSENLTIWACNDVMYKSNFKYSSGTVLLKKGMLIHKWRINEVVGYTSKEFFNKVIRALPKALDFSKNIK